MLQWQIDVGDDSRGLRDRANQLVIDVHGIEIHQSNPIDIDFFQGQQKFAQARLLIKIHPVVSRILGHHDQFAHAVGGQLLSFRHHGFDRFAGMLAAHLGNGTESAKPVASLGDFQVGEVPWRDTQAIGIREGTQRGRLEDKSLFLHVAQQSVGHLRHLLAAKHSHQRVDLRTLFQQLLLLPLGQTPRHDDPPRSAFAFESQHLVDRRVRFFAQLSR